MSGKEDNYRPGACRQARFPEDDAVRKAGFRIHARPDGRQAVWARGGKFYAHRHALVIAKRESAEKKEVGS